MITTHCPEVSWLWTGLLFFEGGVFFAWQIQRATENLGFFSSSGNPYITSLSLPLSCCSLLCDSMSPIRVTYEAMSEVFLTEAWTTTDQAGYTASFLLSLGNLT